MHCSSCQYTFLLTLAVISPLIAHYILSTSHGSKHSHLAFPVPEIPEPRGSEISWTNNGEGRAFPLLSHVETTSKLLTEKPRLHMPF